MSFMQPFAPRRGGNQNATASTTSQAITIGAGEKQLRICCAAGGGNVYVYDYNSTNASAVRAATTADYCVMAGQASIITKVQGHDMVAIITDAGTAVTKLIPGEGF